MGNSCSPCCRWWCLFASFVLSFFPLDVLDGIWVLIESVSEGFLTYSDRPCRRSVFNPTLSLLHTKYTETNLIKLTLLLSERPKLYEVLAVLGAIGINSSKIPSRAKMHSNNGTWTILRSFGF